MRRTLVSSGFARTAFSVFSSGLLGAVVGACGLSLLVTLLYALQDSISQSSTSSDGQFVLVYVVTIPIGSLLGAVVGVSRRLAQTHSTQAAALCIIGGIIPVIAVLAWILPEHPDRIFSIWAAAPLLLAACVFVYGMVLSYKARARPW